MPKCCPCRPWIYAVPCNDSNVIFLPQTHILDYFFVMSRLRAKSVSTISPKRPNVPFSPYLEYLVRRRSDALDILGHALVRSGQPGPGTPNRQAVARANRARLKRAQHTLKQIELDIAAEVAFCYYTVFPLVAMDTRPPGLVRHLAKYPNGTEGRGDRAVRRDRRPRELHDHGRGTDR